MSTLRFGLWVSIALIATTSIPGCATKNPENRLIGPESATNPRTPARPALLLGSKAISRDALWPLLAEYGGAEIVREIVLDHAIAEELRKAGLTISEDDVEAERVKLMTRLAPDAEMEEAAEITRVVLESRGLGPERLRGLLTRNAGLRKLIASDAEPTPESVELAYRVRYGPKRDTRIISTGTAASAQDMLMEIRNRAHDIGLLAAFAEIATKNSIDNSANLGGSLGPISAEDPGLPVSLRQVLASIEPMSLSSIVALENSYAVILVEQDIPAENVTLDEVYVGLETDVRERQQRLMMETRARQLLTEYQPSVLDGSLRWSWDRRGELSPR
ncbi:MAG: peptidylprolyl isomerase [Phycisphaerales bacterium]|nr:peptidylprolyl isomerase [Phycisphaerales bacterium]MCB9836214.1 peptidylprolyl isomerase [Phycisphaera sp.]